MTSTIPTPTSLDEVPAAVEARLREFFAAALPVAEAISPAVGAAAEVVRDFVLQGGKRIRPVFVYAGWRCGISARAAGADAAEAADTLRVCAALELVQACALIHDDIIDRSDTRRGRPTVHRDFEHRHRDRQWSGDPGGFGVAAAILAGDLALAWADDLVHGLAPGAAPDDDATPLPAPVGATWASMRTEVLGGQYLDIVNEAAGDESVQAAYQVMEYKTAAYTVARPLELGARMAGAPADLIADLRSVGHDLGIAFQLRDDLLGVFGDPARTGKPSGDDLISGKRTALLATALRRAGDTGPRLAAQLRDAIGRELSDDELDSARSILVDVGAVDEVESTISELLTSALSVLARADIGPQIRSELTAVAHRTAHREA
ncbi:Polyprenyl synthetase [Gordonia bronchialis DSM 43247]|uniref:Polyprenyl synthetase n=1 Tax=Gordonia bronchialis (strain ATCC 25592 / DSM 43247 / BCRC 13721 / JCM 3198 / KCTC 3076 / NBRC 16047 / NCTC 10667) TaxID=526226 RepID=D0LAU7_GORB4|nr:polyprenyl synthetase family protein [Gordonia bronchialis]ACY22240.1 Polyprenyl synthetase [Gordonia bronchialis DSM 43247]MCC3325031.1 polyprenyl synthetase family protein [Gordonia bronchialis]QGS24218.1 polyprenyl synthetase family protein [Gordonia bronchialis]STQ65164.1 Heptaprenyl diphosphate synthase component 2 [Gordonia bronchialis]